MDVLKIRRKLRVSTELDKIIGFNGLLRTVAEPAVSEKDADAAGSQILLVRS